MNGTRTFQTEAAASWLPVEPETDFPLQNLPYGIFRTDELTPRACTRIGDTVIDLYALAKAGYFGEDGPDPEVFNKEFLNDFIALGKPVWQLIRNKLTTLYNYSATPPFRHSATPPLRHSATPPFHHPVTAVTLCIPVRVGDYTDFYSSIEHATNVGSMFRDPANALLPNWRHIPIGYHGRSSSILVSGTPVHRPNGQTKADDKPLPEFGPTRQLDFELEIAFITGVKTAPGESIPVAEAEDAIFGMVIFNDLSARDIQKWEYVPLGPFLSKNFASVISPWVVTLEALEPFRVKGPRQEPEVLPYLRSEGNRNLDIHLEVLIRPQDQDEFLVCRSNFRYMYWNMAQQLAHQTSNGCNINVGDMYASGTISGPTPDSYGSMLEIAWKGTKPVRLPDGSERTFIADHDTIIMRGYAKKDGLRIGFGEVETTILPAK